MLERIRSALYRQRMRMILFGVLAFVVLTLTVGAPWDGVAALFPVLGLVMGLFPVEPQDDPGRTVGPPVTGRWLALNSPTTKVPSHGVRAYGQAYAIDLTLWPDDGAPDWGSGWARADSIAGFGEPVHSMVDGEVVRATGWRRDHRCRTSLPAILCFFAEGAVRELGGPGWVVGNHVVVRSDDGAFALVAHLRRGSVRVRVGDRVRVGEVLGACGNSGNSTVPHVHAHLMDRASAATGLGLPLRIAEVTVEQPDGDLPAGMKPGTVGHRYPGVPADGELLVTR